MVDEDGTVWREPRQTIVVGCWRSLAPRDAHGSGGGTGKVGRGRASRVPRRDTKTIMGRKESGNWAYDPEGHRHLDTAAACTAQGARYAKDIRVSSAAISTRKGGEDARRRATKRTGREREGRGGSRGNRILSRPAKRTGRGLAQPPHLPSAIEKRGKTVSAGGWAGQALSLIARPAGCMHVCCITSRPRWRLGELVWEGGGPSPITRRGRNGEPAHPTPAGYGSGRHSQ